MPGPGVHTGFGSVSAPAQTLKDETLIYREVLRANVAAAAPSGKQTQRQS